MDYNFPADLLNKFSQLTPWVQAVVILGLVAVALAPFCCITWVLRLRSCSNCKSNSAEGRG